MLVRVPLLYLVPLGLGLVAWLVLQMALPWAQVLVRVPLFYLVPLALVAWLVAVCSALIFEWR